MKLASRPLLTQSVTTAVLFATGDTMAQQLVEKKGFKNHELARTGRMALYGGGELIVSILYQAHEALLY
jgi:protein Mpv17